MSRLIFKSVPIDVDPYSKWEPFPPFQLWRAEAGSIEVVEIGKHAAQLPHGDPRNKHREDGLVRFFKEAYRCMKPHGLLTFSVPSCENPLAVADPENVRYFNKGSFLYFAKPADEDEWNWKKYGPDYGVRFQIINCVDVEGVLTCTMERLGD